LTNFLNKNNFFYDNQFGFRQNHSTSSALITLTEYITNALENNEIPISVFIDLSKAFDTLNHSILLTKLEHAGIRGIANELIKDYLSHRFQRVFYNNVLSTPMAVTCGVPQGSILGPLLFLVYINDIHRSSSIMKFILFADDTTLLASNKSLSALMNLVNEELHVINEWLKTNKLSLNIAKTHYIIFREKTEAVSVSNTNLITINNTVISKVPSTKFLRRPIEINSEFTWKDHIKSITKKWLERLV